MVSDLKIGPRIDGQPLTDTDNVPRPGYRAGRLPAVRGRLWSAVRIAEVRLRLPIVLLSRPWCSGCGRLTATGTA